VVGNHYDRAQCGKEQIFGSLKDYRHENTDDQGSKGGDQGEWALLGSRWFTWELHRQSLHVVDNSGWTVEGDRAVIARYGDDVALIRRLPSENCLTKLKGLAGLDSCRVHKIAIQQYAVAGLLIGHR